MCIRDRWVCWTSAPSISPPGKSSPVIRWWSWRTCLLYTSITYTSIGAAVVEDFYDENVVFLRFCFEKELLKKLSLIHI